jgi:hypothetical protein
MVMKKITVILIVSVFVCNFSVNPTSAEDLNPPDFRYQDGTTYARWEFFTDDPMPIPDDQFNPYGTASMEIWPGVGQAYWPQWGGRDGVWPLSGAAEIAIDNRPEPLPYKDILVQLTWAEQVQDVVPLIWETISGVEAELLDQVTLNPTGEAPPADGFWYHSTYLIHLEPNPDFEIVRIDGAVMIDELVIDTICIPEPCTIALLGLGGMVLLRRKSRS